METFKAVRYFDSEYRGIEDSLETDDFDKVLDFLHEAVSRGNFLSVRIQ